MACPRRTDGHRQAETGVGNGGATGRDQQVWNVFFVDEKLVAMPVGNDAPIAGRDKDEGNAALHQKVGNRKAWLVTEKDVQTDDIHGLVSQDLQGRRHRLRLGDDSRASIAQHVMHQFADELSVFYQQDAAAIHLQGRTLTVPGDVPRMKQ
jgi:hypothetical protein